LKLFKKIEKKTAVIGAAAFDVSSNAFFILGFGSGLAFKM